MGFQGPGGAGVVMEGVRFSHGEANFAFDFALDSGRIAALMGPSGAGKTTLLNLIAGFETPDAGRITIGGTPIDRLAPAARPVSMVFQENNLFGHINVFDNVALGISPSLRLRAQDRARVAQALEGTGLAGKENRLPAQLSGGERQRVALARVLLRERPVLLLDEPFASLGPALRRDMLDLVANLHQARKMTILMVTHQPDDARQIAQDVLFLENGRISVSGEAAAFFSAAAPQAFKAYLGRDDAEM